MKGWQCSFVLGTKLNFKVLGYDSHDESHLAMLL